MIKLKKLINEIDTSGATNIEQALVDSWKGQSSGDMKLSIPIKKIDDVVLNVRRELRTKSKEGERIGGGNYKVSNRWTKLTKKTADVPKTDIILADNNISVKYGPSQLMSGFKEESEATFIVAADKSGLSSKSITKAQEYFDKFVKNQKTVGYPVTVGEISKMTPKEAKKTGNAVAKKVIDDAKILHKEFNTYLNDLFRENTQFKIEFIKEAMSGATKFSDEKAIAKYVLAIHKNGDSFLLKHTTDKKYLKSILDKTSFNVSFKSMSYKKGEEKIGYSFSDVIRIGLKEATLLKENISKLNKLEKSKVLNENWIEDLYSNLIEKIKLGLVKVKEWLSTLPQIIKNIFEWIKDKFENLLSFLNIEPEITFDNVIDFYETSEAETIDDVSKIE